MKKQLMPFLLFLSLMIFAACGGSEEHKNNNTNTDSTTTTNTTATNVDQTTTNTTTIDNTDSSENTVIIADNTTTETPSTSVSEQPTQPTQPTTNTKTGKQTTTTISNNTNKTESSTTSSTPSNTTTNNTKEPTTTTEKEPSTTSKTTTTTQDTKPEKLPLSHDSFNELLGKYVNSAGRVDYAGFKRDKAKLVDYLEHLGDNPPQSNWSKNKEMAFWINLYNAFTIKLILDKYPVKSIIDLNGGKVWDVQKINIGGKNYTLGQIEADQLLKKFKEPRVHFAVNCAAASCPPLLNKAWTEDNIQRYYDKQAKVFVNNSNYNTLSTRAVQLSQIFNWYASDFGGANNLIKYIQKYSTTTIKDKAKVSFREYDWKLNKQ